MNPTDMAILSVIGHGGIANLRKAGFSWEWMSPGDAQTVVKEAMTLDLQGQPVNITNVMLRIKVSDWQPVLQAWTDGYGSTAMDAALKAKEEYMRRNVAKWLRDTEKLASDSPLAVGKWFPRQVEEAQMLLKRGDLYSPKPTAHVSKPIPVIYKPFSKPCLNSLFRGGVWKPALLGISSVNGGGKTTTAITIAAECSSLGLRNAIISAEIPEQAYVYRIMRVYGFSKQEFLDYAHGDGGTERGKLFREYLETLDATLSVYGSEFMDVDRIRSIMAIERPDVLQIDHLLAVRLAQNRGNNDSMAAGNMIYGLQDASNKYSCMTIAYGQLSNADAELFLRNHDLPFVKFFGSGIVSQAMRWAALTCKHWAQENVQYFRVKKNSLEETGKTDTEHFMAFDRTTASYVDEEKGYEELAGGSYQCDPGSTQDCAE